MRALFICLLSFGFCAAEAKLNVVTTTSDLQALVQSVGGAEVDVLSIAKGTQDPHQIEAKPSFMVKLAKADLVLAQGLELESAWILPLVQGARNPKINPGTPGFFELGPELQPIDIPANTATRADGDVHPGGNPHFQLDPVRLGQAAVLIAKRMGQLDSAHQDLFLKNANALQKDFESKSKAWKLRIQKTGIQEVVTYHKTFSYFLDRFGIKASLQLEPKPGIPPTASHLVKVIGEMKQRKIYLVLIEDLYEDTIGQKIKTEISQAQIKRVPVSVGGEPGINTNEQLIENLVKVFESAKP